MNLRQLRLWHWRKVLAFRKKAREYEDFVRDYEAAHPNRPNRYARNKARFNNARANWHLGAVQALNDCFPIGDTAEQDHDKEN